MSLWKIILKQSLAWASVAISGFAFAWVVGNFQQVMGTAPKPSSSLAQESISTDSSPIPDFPQSEKIISVSPKVNPLTSSAISTGLTLRDNPSLPQQTILKAAASDTATFKGLKITGWLDITSAEIRGLNVTTTVNNFYTTQSNIGSSASNSGSAVATATAPPPIIVYNSSATRQTESWQPVVGQIGGVSYDFSVGRNLTIDQNATVGSNLTIASASNSSGNLTVYGSATVSGSMGLSAATFSGVLTANGSVTLGDSSGDDVTVNGRLSTLNVSDGSTTSTISKNSLFLAQDSSNNLGKFYIDSSGNLSASVQLPHLAACLWLAIIYLLPTISMMSVHRQLNGAMATFKGASWWRMGQPRVRC